MYQGCIGESNCNVQNRAGSCLVPQVDIVATEIIASGEEIVVSLPGEEANL